jgi:phosphatidylglycerophosphate synthase
MANYAEKWHSPLPQWTPPSRLMLEAGLGLVALATAGAAIGALGLLPLSWRGTMTAVVAYAMVAALIGAGLSRHAPHRHFGLANSITLCRAAFGVLLLSLAAEELLTDGRLLNAALLWPLVIAAAIALMFDGVDGWAARRSNMTSEFGARFDTESDGLFALALALLLAGAGIVGIWVLANALIYYAFRLAALAWPLLSGPLFPSWRRKAVCVIDTGLLVAALTPAMPPLGAQLCCLVGLGLLVYSFGVDTVWLISQARYRYAEGFAR